jgi:hypothetical protein
MKMRRHPCRSAAAIRRMVASAAVTTLLATSTTSRAAPATETWAGSNGGSFVNGPWTPSGPPIGGDTAIVNVLNPAAPYTIKYDGNYGPGANALVSILFNTTNALSSTITPPLLVTQAGGGNPTNLYAGTETIGNSATANATFAQSAAAHAISGTLTLSAVAGGTGAFSLSGAGSLLSAGTETVGAAGVGSFTQSDGSHHVTSALTLGLAPASSGSYTLTGGILATASTAVGLQGAGSFSQNGGTHTVAGTLTVAGGAGSLGAYSLSGTGSLTTDVTYVGVAGAGSFVQPGGTHTSRVVYVGFGAGTGSYSLSGTGTLEVTGQSPGLAVGFLGTGSFVQSGGTVISSSDYFDFSLGSATNSGYYSLSGTGSLLTNSDYYDGQSTFAQSGGTHTAVYMDVAESNYSNVTYSLSDGSLSVAFLNLGAGSGAHATLAQTGGSATFRVNLYVGSFFNSAATYSLSGSGTVSANASFVGYAGSGTFVQSGGTHSVTGALTIGGAAAGNGTYLLSAGDLSAADVAVGPAAVGTLTISGTAAATVAHSLTLYSAPAGSTVNLAGGTLSIGGALDLRGHPENFHWTGGTLHFPNGYAIDPSFALGTTVTVPAGGTLSAGAASTNAGTLVLGPGTALAGAGTLTNSGAISLAGASLTAPVVNAAGGILFGSGTVAGAFTNAGNLVPQSGTLTVTGPFDTSTGTILLPAGATLKITSSPVANSGTITLTGGTLDTAGQPLTNTGVISGHGALAKTPSLVNNGSVAVLGGALALSGPVTGTGSLYVDPASSLSAPGGIAQSLLTARGTVSVGAPSSLATLAIDAPTGSLDLGASPLTLSATPADTVRQYLSAHRLFSSLSDSTHSLGYIPGLVVKLTPTGDANLDGKIDADDYALLDQGFATHGTFWWQGDFNYDGTVDASDYLLLDRTYLLTQSPTFDATPLLARRDAQFGDAYVNALLTSVPEPAAPLVACGIALLPTVTGRRRRACHARTFTLSAIGRSW